MRTIFILALLLLAGQSLHAQIIAEDLLVSLDATVHPTNEVINVITNTGSMGGVFEATGGGITTPRTTRIGGNGTRALLFNGLQYMQHVDAPGGNLQLAAPGIVGTNRTVTIEAWVFNNTFPTEETIVAWGRRGGPNGSNMSFNYGSDPNHGAVGHWGGADIGWGINGTPTAGQWHHLVYTYDGTMTKVYADGQLANMEVLGSNAIVTHTNTPITLAAQLNSNATVNDGLRGSLAIGRLRIHDGVLSEFEVNQNYQLEVNDFTTGPYAPLSNGPVHRYSFDGVDGPATNGTPIPDLAGNADGTVRGDTGTFIEGMLSVPGGSYTNAAFVDLPNGILSTNSANNGGTGQVTIEGWNIIRGNNTWGRLFDFGSSTAGEIIGTGTASSGLDWLILSAQLGGDTSRKRLEITDLEPINNGRDIFDFESYTPPGTLHHYAVTWDEASGTVTVYENGYETASYTTAKQISDINDINNWLARGQWSADQVMSMDIDEFRMYDYILSPEQVAANAQFGPNVVYLPPGPLQGIRIEVAHTNLFIDTEQTFKVFADYQNVTNIDITASNITYELDVPDIIQIVTTGLLETQNAGDAKLSAVFGGATNTVNISVRQPSATLRHRYSFTSDANDSVGNAHGTFINAATNANGRLILSGNPGDYLELPPFLLKDTYALTVEAFVDFGAANGTFTRLFDFGAQNQALQGRNYVFFSPTGTGNLAWLEASKTDPGTPSAQVISSAPALSGTTNRHVVCIFHPAARSMQLFLDGCLVAERDDINIESMAEIDDRQNWIGRSLYNNDGYLSAEIDELRIYDGVMPPEQVAFGEAAGPDNLPSSDPGNLLATRLSGSSSMTLETQQTLEVFGDFEHATNVNLCAFDIDFVSGDEQIAVISTNGVITALREGTATIYAGMNGISNQLTITTLRDGILNVVHRYPFDGNTDDVVGGANGSLTNSTGQANFQNGQLQLGNNGSQVSSAGGDYVNLPNGIISALPSNATFEVWSTWNDSANRAWQRIFDLGLSNGGENIADSGTGTRYILLTPRGGPGVNTFAYQTQNPGRNERRVLDTVTATPGVETHYVVSWSGDEGIVRFYVNGLLVGTGALHMQLNEITDLNNWLGRSQFGQDTYFVGSYNEFRIYHGAMNAIDVADSFAAGPDALDASPTELHIQWLNTDIIRVSWPTIPGAYTLQSATGASGAFTNSPLSVITEGLESAVYPPTTEARQVFRLIQP